MSTLLFVLFFLLLGLGTVLFAMRSGRSGPLFDSNKRGSRRTLAFLTLLVVVGFGIAIPIAAAVNGADRAEEAGPVKLNASQMRGRELFSPTCSQCHTLHESNAVGRVGPNLDVIRPPASLVEDAIDNGRYLGRGQMPDKLFEGQDVKDIAAYVAAVAGR
jgi:cytochrome c553